MPGARCVIKVAGMDLDTTASSTWVALQRCRSASPLVQCITNFVSMDLMANVLLAAGASPAMVGPPAVGWVDPWFIGLGGSQADGRALGVRRPGLAGVQVRCPLAPHWAPDLVSGLLRRLLGVCPPNPGRRSPAAQAPPGTANVALPAHPHPQAHSIQEVEDFVGISSALLVNVGTLTPDWVESMKLAAVTARAQGKPWVLDPVGCGATPARTKVMAGRGGVGCGVVWGRGRRRP